MTQAQLDRSRALAGIFQAATVVNDIAVGGRANAIAFETCIESIFKLDPESVNDIYGPDAQLSLGLNGLEQALSSGQNKQSMDTIRYALGLLHLEALLRKQSTVLDVLRTRIESSAEQSKLFDTVINDSTIAQLADIYVDTLGSFRYRIQVKGDANLLQQTAYANKIRAVLLAGVRSAILWRQLGGRRWQLMFFRKRELENIKALSRTL